MDWRKNQAQIYNIMKNGISFDWFAFFFPELALVNRKMYLEAIIVLIIAVVASIALGGSRIVVVVYRIVTAFLFYPLYKKTYRKKNKEIKKKQL